MCFTGIVLLYAQLLIVLFVIKFLNRIRYSKKVKILKRPKNIILIQELTTDVPDLQIMEEDKNDDTNSFFNLYCKITKAESQNKISNQEVIKCYFSFGKAISEKLDI